MTADLLTTADPEAAAFFADARASLTQRHAPASAKPKPTALPADWPITPRHQGATLTRSDLHASRGHALRISYDWIEGRQVMWVARWRGGEWSILEGYEGRPACLLTSPHSWDGCVRAMNSYIQAGRAFGGDNLTVDEWLPEFTTVCLAHGADCANHQDGHEFVQRRTLSRFPAGTHRPCGGSSTGVLGGGGHDGEVRYRFQVNGCWRQRFGCRRHHAELFERYLGEADGTVTVSLMDDHIAAPA
jgi:hypothetical protein